MSIWFWGEMVHYVDGVMVNQHLLHIWWNGESIIWCNGDMAKFSNGEFFLWGHGEKVKFNFCIGMIFFVGVIIFPWDVVLGDNCRWREFCIPGKLSRGICPRGFSWEGFVPRDNTWQHSTHYWYAICRGRCLEIMINR